MASRYKAKQVGNDLEKEVAELLNKAGIPYVQESTVTSGRKRSKGGVDFILKNPLGMLECKRFTKLLTVKLGSEDHDLKWSQVIILYREYMKGNVSGLVVQETNDKTLYFIHINDFMGWWIVNTKKSLNLTDVKEMGIKILDIKDIVGKVGDSVDKE